MLTYSFDERGATPLYEYLYARLRDDILAGNLARGEKLPSRRAFAANLGVSVVTVDTAYAQLLAEGFLRSEPKRGYYVSDIVSVMPAHVNVPQRKETVPETALPYTDLTGGRSGAKYFPFTQWSRIMRALLNDRREELLRNPPSEGVEELRLAIAAHLKAFRGMDVPWRNIVVGSGTEQLYSLLVRLLGTERVYAVEDPGYTRPLMIYTDHGARCVRIPMDAQGIPAERLTEAGADIAHITPSHHFPTGLVMPVGRRYELLQWAYAAPSRYIIEDDYDSELRLTGRPIPALRSIDRHGRVIYMNTFSKTLASTIRAAYMVLPEDLAERFRDMRYHSSTMSNFEQYALAAFIGQGHFEKHLNRMRNLYRAKRDLLLASVRSHPRAKHTEILEEDAGLHFLLRVDTRYTDAELTARASARGLRVETLSAYASDGRPEHTFIVNYASLDDDTIPETVAALMETF